MTLQRLWANIDTVPDLALAARLALLFLALGFVCGAIMGARWVLDKGARDGKDAARWRHYQKHRPRW